MSKKTITWLAFGLFASIVFNVFLAGHMLGRGDILTDKPPRTERVREHRSQSGGDIELPILHALRGAISHEEMGQVVDKMRERFPDRHAAYKRLFTARRALFNLLVADTYDVKAVEAAFNEVDEAHRMTVAPARDMLSEILPKLDANSRQKHLSALRKKEHERRAVMRERTARHKKRRIKPK